MLLEFTVGNFLSFKERERLNLNAAAIKKHAGTNLITTGRHKLLKSVVIYGANSSGKSNLIQAMDVMRGLVLESFERSSLSELGVIPFLLQKGYEKKPSYFEVLFLIDGVKYRYGFEVDNVLVKAEWLFKSEKQAEKPLFIREGDDIEVRKIFTEGRGLEEKTRDNTLFLVVADRFNGKTAKVIINWFRDFVSISGLGHELYRKVTFDMFDDKKTEFLLQAFFDTVDLGFDAVKLTKREVANLSKDSRGSILRKSVKPYSAMVRAKTLHKRYDEENREIDPVDFDMQAYESVGTNKVFNIVGLIFTTLLHGGILVIDELDSSLHPLLTLTIIKLFNSKEYNLKNAQLIFATHDTNLLSYGDYRRDQIYFVEKDPFGASDLYSLMEYKEEGSNKTLRKDCSFEKDYIQGRYGAIPFIGNFSDLMQGWQGK
ncbi:MAG: AAA family ATPase [Flavobacteriales bacterium AspAUS03]